MTAFGIDLGTTNSVIAHVVDGKPVALAIAGSPIVPSVVMYVDGKVVVGREARNLELQHPERTLRSVKRKMGTDHALRIARPRPRAGGGLRGDPQGDFLREGAAQATGSRCATW